MQFNIEEVRCNLKENVTMDKKELLIVSGICFVTGLIVGLILGMISKGINANLTIASNNGNNNGNNNVCANHDNITADEECDWEYDV